jgi:hypothetical protein
MSSSESLIHAILRTVAYADVFDYPLTIGEIHRYLMGISTTVERISEILLQHETLITNINGLFMLPGREEIVLTRKRRARVAAGLWPQAVYYGRMISRLPFIRMVAVTGALTMNNIEEGADVDFLIVTTTSRLWLCRAMTLLIGRYSARQGVIICPNYLINLHALIFPDQNNYVAHEIAQMVPLGGLDVYDHIRKQNQWVTKFLPNADGVPAPTISNQQPASRSLSRPILETVLSLSPISWLENWEMSRKTQKLRQEQWASMESNFSAEVCKGHDQAHQARTQAALEERLARLELS